MNYQEAISDSREQVLKGALILHADILSINYGEVSYEADPKQVDKHHLLGYKCGSLIRITFEEKDNCCEAGRQDYSRKN